MTVAKTDAGAVSGHFQKGIFTFKGIPYAEAKRFELPQRPKRWKGVRSCLCYGPVAPLMYPIIEGNDEMEYVFNHDWGYADENCLRINIWTPSLNDGTKRPVMFWIHGGGFIAGSSQELPSYHGENLSRKGDVVVVSINHRLNILGYLDLSQYDEKYRYSANLSILDIKAALEWVKLNISNFGGNPENVTIFGQSGGGAKITTLMTMPSAKGLFHKAINQSGVFYTPMLGKLETQTIASEILKVLKINEKEIQKLQELPFETLNAAGKKALKKAQQRLLEEGKVEEGINFGWSPSLDGDIIQHQLFTKEAMENSRDIPLLVGSTKNEFGSMFSGKSESSESEVLESILQKYGDNSELYMSEMKRLYPDHKRPTDLIDKDFLFRKGAILLADRKAAINKGASVYMYMFDWQSPVMGGKYKAMHCMDLPFVFDNIKRCKEMTGTSGSAQILADRVSQSWINFARTGNPNHPDLPYWPKYNRKEPYTMHFDNVCTIQAQRDKKLLALVDRNSKINSLQQHESVLLKK